MFAGDKSKPPANASYRHLLWENFHVDHSFDIGTRIQGRYQNKLIGEIDSWGPFFRVSFDLNIHSISQNNEWSGVLYFLGETDTDIFGLPNIYLHSSGVLAIYNNFLQNSQQSNGWRVNHTIVENHWYNIIIETKPEGKVIHSNFN